MHLQIRVNQNGPLDNVREREKERERLDLDKSFIS